MEYEGQICRSPMERASFMLPVAVGCAHNRCRFCMLFKHLQYRVLPLEQVQAEIDRVSAVGGAPRRIFLGDGSAFCLPFERLEEILLRLRAAFPDFESVAMDATVRSVLQKSDAELQRLHELGVTDLYLGIECALEDVLAAMEKGNSLTEAEEAVERLHRAGIDYDAHIMTGICGRGRGEENAEALSAFFLRTRPLRICNFSLFVHEEAPLYADVLAGRYTQADERENLLEELCLLRGLDGLEADYDGMHDSLPFRVRGRLPADRESMCRKLEEKIAEMEAAGEAPTPVYRGI